MIFPLTWNFLRLFSTKSYTDHSNEQQITLNSNVSYICDIETVERNAMLLRIQYTLSVRHVNGTF